jgi:hypothetical protein
MPATRGKLSVAIYEVDEGKIEAYLSDRVMDVEQWQELLDNPPMNYVLLDTPELLGINAPEILSLAHREKEQGKTSDWQEDLPFYGM